MNKSYALTFFISIIIIVYCKIHKITILLNIARFKMVFKSEGGKDMAGHVAAALIQNIDFISVCSTVGSEFIYFT